MVYHLHSRKTNSYSLSIGLFSMSLTRLKHQRYSNLHSTASDCHFLLMLSFAPVKSRPILTHDYKTLLRIAVLILFLYYNPTDLRTIPKHTSLLKGSIRSVFLFKSPNISNLTSPTRASNPALFFHFINLNIYWVLLSFFPFLTTTLTSIPHFLQSFEVFLSPWLYHTGYQTNHLDSYLPIFIPTFLKVSVPITLRF